MSLGLDEDGDRREHHRIEGTRAKRLREAVTALLSRVELLEARVQLLESGVQATPASAGHSRHAGSGP